MRSLFLLAVTLFAMTMSVPLPAQQAPAAPAVPGLTLSTPAWPDGGDIPVRFTQADPMTVSPQLTWTNVPAGTQSFVLHMHDPDAALNRTTSTQVHWLVWGIPGSSTGLAEGQPAGERLPDGSRQVSATGQVYRGPGARAIGPRHHYTFEIYALDTTLDIPHGANEQETRATVMAAMQGHVLGKGVYVGLFKRPE